MARAKTNGNGATARRNRRNGQTATRRIREGVLLLVVAVSAYLTLCLATFSPEDPGWATWACATPRSISAAGWGPGSSAFC